MKPKFTYNEKARIDTLRKYNVSDSSENGSFDEFTKLAAKLFNVPIAIISVVETDRIGFKSKFGTAMSEAARDPGFCASAILYDEFYEVQNAVKDARAHENPLVTGAFGLRFYAAYPLQTKKGHNLGTFCVIDKKPRKLSEPEKETLKSLRNLVMAQWELQHSARNAYLSHNRMLNIFAHDLKNPLATINMASDIIQKKNTNPKAVRDMCGHITKSGKNALQIIEELLESAQMNVNEIQLRLSKFNMGQLLKDVVENNQVPAKKKGQNMKLSIITNSTIEADKVKIEEIFDNLINNAIKYSPENKLIDISLEKKEGNFVLYVKDDGPGLTKVDKTRLFMRFSKLSAQPTGGESSSGLGLYIVKNLVEAHSGSICAKSNGKNKGTTFIVKLPLKKKETVLPILEEKQGIFAQ